MKVQNLIFNNKKLSKFFKSSKQDSNNDNWVYLMYEIERRELRARIYAAFFLVSVNRKVVLFQHSQIFRIAIFAKPGHIFLKSSPYQFDTALKLLKLRGFRIYQWQEEGIHFGITIHKPLTLSRNAIAFTDKYLAWHNFEKKIVSDLGMHPEKILVTGNMRFEYLQALRNYRVSNQGNIRILILTNFDYSLVNYPLTKNATKDILDAESDNQVLLNREMKSAQLNLQLYQNFISEAQIQDFELTVRPYFYENLDKLNFDTTVKIDQNTSIFDSFTNHDILVHYGSTAGLEAVFAGLPSMILAAEPSLINPTILNVGEPVISVKALIERLLFYRNNMHEFSQLVTQQLKKAETLYGSILFNPTHISTIDQLSSSPVNSLNRKKLVLLVPRIRMFLFAEIILKTKYMLRKENRKNRFLKSKKIYPNIVNYEIDKILQIAPMKIPLFKISRNRKRLTFYD